MTFNQFDSDPDHSVDVNQAERLARFFYQAPNALDDGLGPLVVGNDVAQSLTDFLRIGSFSRQQPNGA